jgi:hypothetical protein
MGLHFMKCIIIHINLGENVSKIRRDMHADTSLCKDIIDNSKFVTDNDILIHTLEVSVSLDWKSRMTLTKRSVNFW